MKYKGKGHQNFDTEMIFFSLLKANLLLKTIAGEQIVLPCRVLHSEESWLPWCQLVPQTSQVDLKHA